jgi:hypothetical protein
MLLAAVLSAASADVSGFLGSWFGSDDHGFLGIWSGSDKGELARIVVIPAGVNHVRIHLYGRCQPVACDWGEQLARNHSDNPGSADVRSITAEFNTGTALRRITLRQAPGKAIRFEMVTDFTDHGDRHDYETSGTFMPADPAMAASPAAPEISAAPAAVPAASPPSSMPAEDCEAINPEDVYVAPSNRGWRVADFNHTILDFGNNKIAAIKASHVLEFYRFDEQCFVARPHAAMIYWRTAGQAPRDPMPGQDCTDVRFAAVTVKRNGDAWQVADGDRVLLDYGENQDAAQLATSVIRTYRLNRQCFVAKPDMTMVYWLAQ